MKTPSYFRPNANSEAVFNKPVVRVSSGVTCEASEAKGSRSVPNFALSKAIDRFRTRKDEDANIAEVCGDEVLDMLTHDVPTVPVQILSPAVVNKNKKILDQNVYSLPALGSYLLAADFQSTLGLGPYEAPFELVANVEVFQLCREVRGEPVASQAEVDVYVSRCQRASQKLQLYQTANHEVNRPIRFLGLSTGMLRPLLSLLSTAPMLYSTAYRPRASHTACPPDLLERSPNAMCVDGSAMQSYNEGRDKFLVGMAAVIGSVAVGLATAHARAFLRSRSQVDSARKMLQSEEFRDDDV